MERAHFGFVQPRSTRQRPICDEEQPAQIPLPATDFDATSNLLGKEFGTLEPNIAENYPDISENINDSDVESLNLSDAEGDTPQVGLPIPTKYPTAGRPLWDVVQHDRSEDEMWVPFRNKTDFELARWFIEAKVPKDHVDRYFKQGLAHEDSNIKSAYRLLEAVDELESGMGMKSWKEGFVSFSKAVSKCVLRTFHIDEKQEIPDGEPDEDSWTQKFFYRNPIDCAKYLLCQRCFAQDLVYAPVKEWNSEDPPQRVYSEMHTADWWWETQVGSNATFQGASILYW